MRKSLDFGNLKALRGDEATAEAVGPRKSPCEKEKFMPVQSDTL